MLDMEGISWTATINGVCSVPCSLYEAFGGTCCVQAVPTLILLPRLWCQYLSVLPSIRLKGSPAGTSQVAPLVQESARVLSSQAFQSDPRALPATSAEILVLAWPGDWRNQWCPHIIHELIYSYQCQFKTLPWPRHRCFTSSTVHAIISAVYLRMSQHRLCWELCLELGRWLE